MAYSLPEQAYNRCRGELFKLQHPGWMLPQYLEPTNICNLHCPDCPIDSLKQERGFMSMETVDKVIEVMQPGKPLHLYLMGEPLLHKQIEEIVRRTSQSNKRIYTLLSTNGVFLTNKMLWNFQHGGLKALVISLHTKKSVEAFQMAAETLEGQRFPTLEGRHILTNKEVPGWLDEVGVKEKHRTLISKCNPHGFAGNVPGKQRNLTPEQRVVRMESCKLLQWRVVAVRWNGLVNPCPYDDSNGDTLGHIDNFRNLRAHPENYKICSHCDDTAYSHD